MFFQNIWYLFLSRYVRGNVRDIQHEADDPEWSVNVKKGLLSLLEMNLEKRKEMEQSSPIPQVVRPQSSNEGAMYSVMEVSITPTVVHCGQFFDIWLVDSVHHPGREFFMQTNTSSPLPIKAANFNCLKHIEIILNDN